jgi:hypothetical protein
MWLLRQKLLPVSLKFLFSSPLMSVTSPFFLTWRLLMPKKSKRRAWSTADVRALKAGAKKKTQAASIARMLKRTEGATRQKAFALGLSLDSRA